VSTLRLTTAAPCVAAAGEQVTAEWRLANDAPTAAAANVFVRTTAPLAALGCASGRTQHGDRHGHALVSLAPRAEVAITALVGPLPLGRTSVSATVVAESRSISATATICAA
jgi:hypothetical protein